MMMLSIQPQRLLPLFLLLLVPQEASGRSSRPWSLPTARLAARRDFTSSSQKSFTVISPATLGLLTGGEIDPSSPSDQQQQQQPDENDEPTNLPDEVARGGGATTAALKSKQTSSPEQPVSSTAAATAAAATATTGGATIDKSAATTSPSSSSVNATNATSTTMETKEEKKAKKKALKQEKRFHKKLAKKLRNRNANNLRRKFMHASFGLSFASMNHFIPRETFVPGMAILSSATLLMELLRYRKGFGWMNRALHFVLGKALRKHEMDGKFTGSFYFFTGVTLTAALFPTTCATMGICQLALADPSASYFGRATRHVYWSRIENGLGGFGRNKGFLGFLGGALFCFPFNYRMLSIAKFGAEGMPGGKTSLYIASLALGVAGAFADLAVPTPAWVLPKKICGVRVPPLHLDDNFVVPVVSGFACTQVFKALGWDQNLALARFIFVK